MIRTFALHFRTMNKEAQKTLLTQLASPDEQVVIKALNQIKEKGNEQFVAPLMLVVSNDSGMDEAADIALEILSSLKDTKAHATLLELLEEERYHASAAKFIAAVWQSNIDASEHFAKIVKVALKADYMAVFEALTILEHGDQAIPEPQLIEAQLACKVYLSKNPKSDKKEMVENLLSTISTTDTYD